MISLVVTLLVLGVVIWAIESLIPIDPAIRRIIIVVIMLCVLLYFLRNFALI